MNDASTPPAAALQIVYRPLKELEPYARNARRHTARQIGKLRSSLARFGWTNPMLIAGREMIAGHGRLAAALEMAAAGQAVAGNPDPWTGPTVDLSHLSTGDRSAYRLADNRIALDAGWDNELLRLEMADLQAMGVDLSLTGFANIEIGTILGAATPSSRGLANTGLQYQIVIECKDEKQQAELLAQWRAEGYPCKPLIL
jgi:hypothetical protein